MTSVNPAPCDTIAHGDALTILRTLPDASVQCCISSPPYWGLRDYGTGAWGGGDPECNHQAPPGKSGGQRADCSFTLGEIWREECRKCGARRIDQQIGLERTMDEYIAKITAVFAEVRRVLREDGVLFLNMGDSYASAWACKRRNVFGQDGPGDDVDRGRIGDGLKEKDLCGIPWRVAFALQADGWYLRQDIIWHKPNPMPESVRDRCTKAHEYVFLMSKSARYHYDAEAIKEPAALSSIERLSQPNLPNQVGSDRVPFKTNGPMRAVGCENGSRNRRSVWTVPTHAFPEAHFATFPPDLIKPMVLAGSRPGDTVLDPFMGAGTVALVAKELGRHYTGIELNAEYIRMAERRLRQEVLL